MLSSVPTPSQADAKVAVAQLVQVLREFEGAEVTDR